MVISTDARLDNASPAAPAMLLAEVYAANVDITRYWVSEKFDGVRAQWDGRTLRFRSGGAVPAPAWFTAHFPALPLDGLRQVFGSMEAVCPKCQMNESGRVCAKKIFPC